jgi:hypothetical protein
LTGTDLSVYKIVRWLNEVKIFGLIFVHAKTNLALFVSEESAEHILATAKTAPFTGARNLATTIG